MNAPASSALSPAKTPASVQAGAILRDGREDAEWSPPHRTSGATHMPLRQLGDPDRLPDSRTVVVISRSGRRSTKAATGLHARECHVRTVDDGLLDWELGRLGVGTDTGAPGAIS